MRRRPRRSTLFPYTTLFRSLEYRRMVEQLNDSTGLLVSTFQGAVTGTAFVVDGARGQEFAQKERKPRPYLPKEPTPEDRKSTRLNSSHTVISYAVFCLKKKK